jgi:hypothetical protein
MLVAKRDRGWRLRAYLRPGEPGREGAFSADGRHLLYAIDIAGRTQIVADRYPERDRHRALTREPIGKTVAMHPFWIAGSQLIYASENNHTLRGAPLTITAEGLTAGTPVSLLEVPGDCRGVAPAADGQRFLLAMPVGPRQRPALALVQNWERLLERR